MDIYRITAVGLIGAALSVALKKENPQLAMAVSIAAGVVILGFVLPELKAVFYLLDRINGMLAGEKGYVRLILKITAAAYISSFGAGVCRDFGESSIGDKIELGGKIIILIYAIPVITGLLDMLSELLP